VLDHDAFEEVPDVFTPVGGRLQEVEDLLPFDHDDRVALLVEERDDGVLVDAIGFTLELVDARRELEHAVAFLERCQRFGDPVGRLAHDIGEPPRARPYLRDLVEPHDGRRRIDCVHHVVERDRERVNVFTIERGDEGAVEAIDDRARASIADVLDVLDLAGLGHVWRGGGQHLLERARAAANLFG
jgi:hypothetical protein